MYSVQCIDLVLCFITMYIQILSHYVVHLKLMLCFSYILIEKKSAEDKGKSKFNSQI